MTDAELLTKIKNGLGITGTFQDSTLTIYIDEVKAFMASAGIENSVIESTASVGCILRGVADLWNYGSGNASLSEYFRMRVVQLKKLILLTIKQATGTTIAVTRDNVPLANESALAVGDVLTISVVGGTITVNGKQFTSGNTITVAGQVVVVSTAVNGGE